MSSTGASTPVTTTRKPPLAALVIGIPIAIAIGQLILVLLFAWPTTRSAPHNVDLSLSAPAAIAKPLQAGIEKAMPGAFNFTAVPDDAAAKADVKDRTSYGGLSITELGAEVYTASAASAVVANVISQGLSAALHQAKPALPVKVVDLVPSTPEDPNGLIIIALIPLLITSLVAGGLISFLIKSWPAKLASLGFFAIFSGLLATLAMQPMLGGLSGGWFANALTLGLLCFAISSAMVGLKAIAGLPGIAIGVIFIFFAGFPFSGALSAPVMVPEPWGAIAQWFPAGAGNEALKSVSFFDGAAAWGHLWILIGWSLVAVALTVIGTRLHSKDESALA